MTKRTDDIAQRLREACTVLDEPFHHDAIAVTLMEAATEIEALRSRLSELERAASVRQSKGRPAYD